MNFDTDFNSSQLLPGFNNSCLTDPIPDILQGSLFCPAEVQSKSCWPYTLNGTTATVLCAAIPGEAIFTERYCDAKGNWDNETFKDCISILRGILHKTRYESSVEFPTIAIFYIGFSISLLAIFVALFIFYYFKNLRCVRTTIHCNLMLTFVLRAIIWMVTNVWLSSLVGFNNINISKSVSLPIISRTMVVLYYYAKLTNFFWMFVEGLYLHTLICWAYSSENVQLWMYNLIGWGMPAVVAGVWTTLKIVMDDSNVYWDEASETNSLMKYLRDWPIFILLAANMLFLLSIIWILVNKLRATNTLQISQYTTALKATVILFPLLGMTYILTMTWGEYQPGNIVHNIFHYITIVLTSTQGLAVSVFYCFNNSEVQQTLKNKYYRIMDNRNMMTSNRYTRASTATNLEQMSSEPRVSIVPNNSPNSVQNKSSKPTQSKSNQNGVKTNKMSHVLNGNTAIRTQTQPQITPEHTSLNIDCTPKHKSEIKSTSSGVDSGLSLGPLKRVLRRVSQDIIDFSAQFKNKDPNQLNGSPINRKNSEGNKFHAIDLMSVSGSLKVTLNKLNSEECHLAPAISEDTPLHSITPVHQELPLSEEHEDTLPKEHHTLMEEKTVV